MSRARSSYGFFALAAVLIAAVLAPGPALGEGGPGQGAPPGPAPRPPPPPGVPLPPLAPAPPAPPAETTDEPGVAFIIDGERIERASYGDSLIEEFGDRYAEAFIAERLFLRRAQALGIGKERVDAATGEAIADMVKQHFGGDARRLDAVLASRGETLEDLRRRQRREALARLVARADRKVTDEDVRKLFEERFGLGGERRRARHVFISENLLGSQLYTLEDHRKERPELEADARARAEEARKRLLEGADLAELARERSEDVAAGRGGDYGRHWRGRFGPEVDAGIAAAGPGEPTGVLRAVHRGETTGFVVARVTGRDEGYDYRAHHMLFTTRLEGRADAEARERRREDARGRAEAALARVRAGEDFGKVAREASEDPGSAARGGDLGSFGTGAMVPAFEAALRAATPGEAFGPVETEFGFHVIRLDGRERRPDQDASLASVLFFSCEYVKVKERKLAGRVAVLAREKAEEVADRLAKGEDPVKVVREVSEDAPSRARDGLVEDPVPVEYGPEVLVAFRKLTEAEPVSVVHVKDRGWHVFKLEKLDRRDLEKERAALREELEARDPTVAEIRAYHEKMRAAARVVRGRF